MLESRSDACETLGARIELPARLAVSLRDVAEPSIRIRDRTRSPPNASPTIVWPTLTTKAP